MIIENSKTYNVNDVENLFFRPSFCGKSAEELGIRVLYNMPIPTNIPVFTHHNNILQEFSSGWHGGSSATIDQKEIALSKLKAESSYSAESYFSTIYEMLTSSAEINLGDLSGTDLEKAETELFRRAIVESIYSTMWFGDANGELSDFSAFSGFINKRCHLECIVPVSISFRKFNGHITVLAGLLKCAVTGCHIYLCDFHIFGICSGKHKFIF